MYHLIIIILLIIMSILFGKWHRWRDYLPTMYYFSLFNFFYQYISYSIDKVWELKKTFLSLFITDVTYSFIAYPCIIVMFLGNFPQKNKMKLFHYLKYILISILIESVAKKLGYITYFNGWNIWWTMFFYLTMYPMFRLHYKKPLIALVISAFIIGFYLMIFDFNIL